MQLRVDAPAVRSSPALGSDRPWRTCAMVPKPSKCGRVRSGAGLLRHGSRDYEIIEIASIVGFGGGKETSGPRPRGPNQHPGKAEESKSLAATGRRDSAGGVGLPSVPAAAPPHAPSRPAASRSL